MKGKRFFHSYFGQVNANLMNKFKNDQAICLKYKTNVYTRIVELMRFEKLKLLII